MPAAFGQPALPLLYSRDPKDTCTNVTCFRSKISAYIDREKKRVLAVGGKVLSDDESRRVFQGGSSLPFGSKWVDVDQSNYDDPGRRTCASSSVIPLPAPDARLHVAGEADPARGEGRDPGDAQGPWASTPSRSARSPPPNKKSTAAGTEHRDDPEDDQLDADEDNEQPGAPTSAAEERFEATVARVSRQRIIAAIVAAAESAGADDNRFVQLVYNDTMLHGGYHNAIGDAVKRRLGSKRAKGEYAPTALEEHAKILPANWAPALLLELAISRSGYFTTEASKYPRDLQHAIDLYKLDAKGIEKSVADELGATRCLSGARRRAARNARSDLRMARASRDARPSPGDSRSPAGTPWHAVPARAFPALSEARPASLPSEHTAALGFFDPGAFSLPLLARGTRPPGRIATGVVDTAPVHRGCACAVCVVPGRPIARTDGTIPGGWALWPPFNPGPAQSTAACAPRSGKGCALTSRLARARRSPSTAPPASARPARRGRGAGPRRSHRDHHPRSTTTRSSSPPAPLERSADAGPPQHVDRPRFPRNVHHPPALSPRPPLAPR